MEIGITTRSFSGKSNQEAAAMMGEYGFTSTELCLVQTDSPYWTYNGISDISGLTAKRVGEIANIYRSEGINVHAFGVFTNILEADDDKRQAFLQYFLKHIQFASEAGIPVVSTECGFEQGSRGVRADIYETAYSRFADSLAWLCGECEKYDIILALEPCVLDVVPSAKRMRDLIAQIGSPRLKVLLDPANLIANSSEDDMFFYLKDHVSYFHGKDRKVNDAYGRLVGDGEIDWPRFFALYDKFGEGRPFILEYAKSEQSKEIMERCLKFYEQGQAMKGDIL